MGDPAGVGPELVAKIVDDGSLTRCCTPIIIGDLRVFEQGCRFSGVQSSVSVIGSSEELTIGATKLSLFDLRNIAPENFEIGKPSAVCGKYAEDTVLEACDLVKNGAVDGIVFAPFNKASLKMGGCEASSVTALCGKQFGVPYTCEMSVAGNLWTTRVTSHVPISKVTEGITSERVAMAIDLADSMIRKIGLDGPRLALLGLNPHNGDSGMCGREEIEVIEPAMRAAQDRGICINGLFSPDDAFRRAFCGEFDGIVTMYHDQGEAILKIWDNGQLIAVSGGVPFPMATTSHGTAYNLAGKGQADPTALRKALEITARMANFQIEKEILASRDRLKE
jgi:4-hydroxythreonine-4-phosphate dehydrogenase